MSAENPQEMLNKYNTCDLSKLQMDSPAKRKCLEIKSYASDCMPEDTSNIDMMSPLNIKSYEQSNLKSFAPSFLEDHSKEICNIETAPPMSYKQKNSLNVSLIEGPFKEIIKSISESEIPNEILHSDDAYIIVDEVEDDCSFAESVFESKIVGKDIIFCNADKTEKTGFTDKISDALNSDDSNLSNANKKTPFLNTIFSNNKKFNNNSDQKLFLKDAINNSCEKQEQISDIVNEIIGSILNAIESKTEHITGNSKNNQNSLESEIIGSPLINKETGMLNAIEGKSELITNNSFNDEDSLERIVESPLILEKACKRAEGFKMHSGVDAIRNIQQKELQVVIHKLEKEDLRKYGLQFSDNFSSEKYTSSLNSGRSSEYDVSSSNESNNSFEDSTLPACSVSDFDFAAADSVNMQNNQTLHIVYLNSPTSNKNFLTGRPEMVLI